MNQGLAATAAADSIRAPIGAEIELLLCAARVDLDPRDEERMRALLRGPLAWAELIRLARRHRLAPLLHRHLSRIAPASVRATELATLRAMYARNVSDNLLFTRELSEVLRLLETHGVPALAYKGPVLAHCLYGDLALREIGDLDLLVPRSDIRRARELLGRRGYRPAVPLSGPQEASVLRSDCSLSLVDATTGVIVELHWTPEPSLSPGALEGLWARAEPVRVGGATVTSFARLDLLPLLAMHGGRHMWERLEWLCGLAELARSGVGAWPDIVERADSLGAKRALLVGLVLANGLLRAPVPPAALRAARADGQVERLVAAAARHLFREREELAHRLGYPFHRYQLRSRERMADRLRYLYRRAVTPTREDWSLVPLPDALFPLYTAIRPMRLAARYIHQSLRDS